jgi:hypothetical protein
LVASRFADPRDVAICPLSGDKPENICSIPIGKVLSLFDTPDFGSRIGGMFWVPPDLCKIINELDASRTRRKRCSGLSEEHLH